MNYTLTANDPKQLFGIRRTLCLPSLSSFSLFLLSLPLSSFSLFLLSLPSLSSFSLWEATLWEATLWEATLWEATLSGHRLGYLGWHHYIGKHYVGGYWEATGRLLSRATDSGISLFLLSLPSLLLGGYWEATGRLLSRATDWGVALSTYLSLKKHYIGPLNVRCLGNKKVSQTHEK